MKKIFEKIVEILLLVILLLIATPNKVKALQANPNTQYKKTGTPEEWMTWFREMETTGNAMGLNEMLNSDLTSKETNNIDVHMMRATEYGAIAILSASGYGNPSNDKAITTTTGNNTGVILDTANWEWVAGTYASFSADTRYYDKYTNEQSSAKRGDALGTATTPNPGAAGWHQASYSWWVTSSRPCFTRGYSGLFAYSYDHSAIHNLASRGVAVCGAGL